jgi:hypothetical protein
MYIYLYVNNKWLKNSKKASIEFKNMSASQFVYPEYYFHLLNKRILKLECYKS